MSIFLLDTLLYTITIITVIVSIVLLVALFYYVPVGLWITAQFSGVRISIGQLIGMRLRRVQPKIIVDELIKAKKANLKDVKFNSIEAHYLAKGNVNTVVDALISAKNAGIVLTFDQAAAIDLAGRDVLQAVRDSVNTKVIDSPAIEAVAKDGIQLIVVARITVRAHLEKLVGGAGEETVVARVGQGIVASIGSSETHEAILADPDLISDRILTEGLTAFTAFDPLDHARIQPLPAFMKSRFLGVGFIGIDNQHLGFRLVMLEVIRYQTGALVRPRRAAKWLRRRHNEHGAAVIHGLQLTPQQVGLRSCLIRMRHCLPGGVLVVFNFAPFK